MLRTDLPRRTKLKAACLAVILAPTLDAATVTWTGSSTGGSFNLASNWNAGVPDTDDIANFNATRNVNGTISFSADATVLDMHLRGTSGTINFDVGAGREYSVTRNLIVGAANGEINHLRHSSGEINSNILLIGNNNGAVGNQVTVTGAGTVWNANGSGAIRVGSSGGDNSSLTVSNGAVMNSANNAYLGLQSASNGTITVTDPGSELNCELFITLGDQIADGLPEQTNNQLKILNGGYVSMLGLIVGTTTASPNNTVTVSGPGSHLFIQGGQQFPPTEIGQRSDIGRASPNNSLIVSNGGLVDGGAIFYVGREATSVNNLISVTDSTLIGSGLDLLRGKLFIQNGTVDIFRKIDGIIGQRLGGALTANNATSEIDFRSGQLGSVTSIINTGSPMVVGDGGAIPATFVMKLDPTNTVQRLHQFVNGLVLQSNGRLEGAATVVANITNGGMIAPGVDAGTLRISGTLNFNPGGQVDLGNNKLIVTFSPVGSWNGSAYTGLIGAVQSGRNGGAWDGETGVITSQTLATTSNYTSIGIASASDALGLASSDTAMWGGHTVTGFNTLLMYTYGGDADLSGAVDIDDYGRIDFNASTGGSLTGWTNGDFDYNGVQDIDDYGIIDFVVNIQGPPFATTSDASALIASVPEPAGLIALIPLATMLRRRRTRPLWSTHDDPSKPDGASASHIRIRTGREA